MEQDPNEIGTVKKEDLVNVLHKDSPLPQLRTYQGDIARFIKEKDQSAITIALKEKEEKERVQREEQAKLKAEAKNKISVKLPSGTLRLVLSVFLLAAGVLVGAYAYISRDTNVPVAVGSDSLIRADDKVVVEASTVTPTTFKETVFSAKTTVRQGKIMEIKVADSALQRDVGLPELMAKLKFNMPSGLARSLGQEYMFGVYGESTVGEKAEGGVLFLVFKETDYGIAFRDMLNWEGSLYDNFSSLLVSDSHASASSSPVSVTPISNLSFKDYIISNKDTRAVLAGNQVKLLYTFLDKNTILITESAASLRALVDAYSTRNLVR